MDIHDIERAAMLFYQMCREHPEICPHNYGSTWKTSRIDHEKKIMTMIYECQLCGATMEMEKRLKE
jgi:C4-type Zn-finger protein